MAKAAVWCLQTFSGALRSLYDCSTTVRHHVPSIDKLYHAPKVEDEPAAHVPFHHELSQAEWAGGTPPIEATPPLSHTHEAGNTTAHSGPSPSEELPSHERIMPEFLPPGGPRSQLSSREVGHQTLEIRDSAADQLLAIKAKSGYQDSNSDVFA